MKNLILIATLMMVAATAKADLIVRDTIANENHSVSELAAFSTSDNPWFDFVYLTERNAIEFTAESLKTSGVSKIELFEMISKGLKNRTHDYIIVIRKNDQNPNRSDLQGIMVRQKLKKTQP